MNEKYCKGCMRKIQEGVLGFGGERFYHFEEGIYCDSCAKVIVEKRRKELNG